MSGATPNNPTDAVIKRLDIDPTLRTEALRVARAGVGDGTAEKRVYHLVAVDALGRCNLLGQWLIELGLKAVNWGLVVSWLERHAEVAR